MPSPPAPPGAAPEPGNPAGPGPRLLGLAGAWGLLAAALLLPLFVSDYNLFQLSLVCIQAVALLGLNLLVGFNGQFSLGHGAFYAMGAYTAAIMITRWQVGYLWTLPAAGVVCFCAGLLFGLPAVRIKGMYLALATLALALATPQILKYDRLGDWSGGVQGIELEVPPVPWGLPLSSDQWLYFLCLAVLAPALVTARNLLRGRPGRAMMAIRDNQVAAEALGIDAARYKALTFGVSALYTGVAGALSALVVGYVAPDSYSLFLSITLLAGSVVGGMTSVSGAVYGAIFIQFVPNLADMVSKSAPWAVYGVVLIVFMYALPGGIAEFIRKVGGKLLRLRQRQGREEYDKSKPGYKG